MSELRLEACGENPPLPPDLIGLLHQHVMVSRHRVSDFLWGQVASGAVSVFESYQRMRL